MGDIYKISNKFTIFKNLKSVKMLLKEYPFEFHDLDNGIYANNLICEFNLKEEVQNILGIIKI